MEKVLKVVSVLKMISGGLGTALAVLTLTGGALVGKTAVSVGDKELVAGAALSGLLLLALALLHLAGGICGMKGAAGDQKKLTAAVILGWIALAWYGVSAAMTLMGPINGNIVMTTVFQGIVPVLFVVSAMSVQKQR